MAFSPAKLKALREAKNWSQSDLARRIWGSQTNQRTGRVGAKGRDNIFRWEKGAHPDSSNLKLLADALGVAPTDLCDAPAPRRAPEKARLWETAIQEAADYLKAQGDPRARAWVSVITAFIGWEHPVREMLDVLVR